MKIINSTCYNTEDLERLWVKTREAYHRNEDERERACKANGQWFSRRKLRGEDTTPVGNVLIGYSANPGSSGWQYTANTYATTRRRPNLRIGIIKKSKLPLDALTALANVADGDPSVPYVVVCNVVAAMLEINGGWGLGKLWNPAKFPIDPDGSWGWIKDFKLGYAERAKKGAKKAANVERQKGKLESMLLAVTSSENEVRAYEINLKYARKGLVEQKIALEMQKKLVESLVGK